MFIGSTQELRSVALLLIFNFGTETILCIEATNLISVCYMDKFEVTRYIEKLSNASCIFLRGFI